MPQKKLSLILFSLAMMGVALFIAQSITKTDSGSQNTSEQKATAKTPRTDRKGSAEKPPPSLESYRKQLASARSNEELVAILRRLFAENEALAIEAFALLDSTSPILQDSYVITDFFREYFSERYTALEALDRVELWAQKKPIFFKYAGIDLLTRHSAKDDPAKLVEFLNDKNHAHIAMLVHEDVGYELGKNDPVAALGFVGQLNDPSARKFLREGIFSRWMVNNPTEVAEYLNENDLDASYDNILERFVERSESDLVDVYLEWADLIQDPELRKSTLLSLAKRWESDSAYKEEYEAWKSTLAETDSDLLAKVHQNEKEATQRRQIKDDFEQLFSETKKAYANNDVSRYNTAIEGIATSMRDLMTQLETEPGNIVVRQELDTVYDRLEKDQRAGGNLPPSLKSVFHDYTNKYKKSSE